MTQITIEYLTSRIMSVLFEIGMSAHLSTTDLLKVLESRHLKLEKHVLEDALEGLLKKELVWTNETGFKHSMWKITEQGCIDVKRRIDVMKSVRMLPVHQCSTERMLNALEKYREKNGDTIVNLTDALGMGCLMADFFLAPGEGFKELENNDIEATYGSLVTNMFVIGDNMAIPPGKTIGIFDMRNRRSIYAVVTRPGQNTIYVQNTDDDADISEITLLGHPEMKALLHMEPVWKDGNNFDKVMVAQMFGFEYDKKDDEILVPLGRCESSIAISLRLATQAMEETKDILGL